MTGARAAVDEFRRREGEQLVVCDLFGDQPPDRDNRAESAAPARPPGGRVARALMPPAVGWAVSRARAERVRRGLR